MSIYKIEKCYACNYKHNQSNPNKANQPCPKCGEMMRHIPAWYIAYQVQGRKYVEACGEVICFFCRLDHQTCPCQTRLL